jgi:predicted Zn-dependent protease with MMP-like domain
MQVDRHEFERLVGDAIDEVPDEFAAALEEVAVVVEDRAPPHLYPLYGLYQGIPLTEGYAIAGALPPHISIYMYPMLQHCRTAAEVVEQVRITVLHELGHHLGFDEERLHDLGYG